MLARDHARPSAAEAAADEEGVIHRPQLVDHNGKGSHLRTSTAGFCEAAGERPSWGVQLRSAVLPMLLPPSRDPGQCPGLAPAGSFCWLGVSGLPQACAAAFNSPNVCFRCLGGVQQSAAAVSIALSVELHANGTGGHLNGT